MTRVFVSLCYVQPYFLKFNEVKCKVCFCVILWHLSFQSSLVSLIHEHIGYHSDSWHFSFQYSSTNKIRNGKCSIWSALNISKLKSRRSVVFTLFKDTISVLNETCEIKKPTGELTIKNGAKADEGKIGNKTKSGGTSSVDSNIYRMKRKRNFNNIAKSSTFR